MLGEGRRGVCLFEVLGLPAWSGKKNRRTSVRRLLIEISERKAHSELHHTGSTQAEDTRSLPDAEIVDLVGAVDGSGASVQPARHGSWGQVEIGEVKQVV